MENEKEIIGTGKTVEEAIDSACEQLGIAREISEWEILDLPKKGILGLRGTPARVRVSYKQSKAKCAQEYLAQVLQQMGLASTGIIANEREEGVTFTLEGDGLGFIIGRRGETLDALQYLTGLAANKMDGDYFRVTIDSGHYREKREKTLAELAVRLARNAVKTGRSSTLEPMNPYERRIIHSAVQTVEGAVSASFGEEPNRRVVISSKNPVKSAPRPGGLRPSGYGGDKPYGDRKPYNGDKKPYNNAEKKSYSPYSNDKKPYNNSERKPYNPDHKPYDADRKPYNPDRKPYNPDHKPYDSERKPYSPDRKPYGNQRPASTTPAPSQQPKAVPANEAADKPLYSKIELD